MLCFKLQGGCPRFKLNSGGMEVSFKGLQFYIYSTPMKKSSKLGCKKKSMYRSRLLKKIVNQIYRFFTLRQCSRVLKESNCFSSVMLLFFLMGGPPAKSSCIYMTNSE